MLHIRPNAGRLEGRQRLDPGGLVVEPTDGEQGAIGAHAVPPSVDAVGEWLVRADERYRAEAPDESWPGAYATWFLEWDEAGVD